MKDVYLVKSGDTLTKIAKTHGKTRQELIDINGLKNPNFLQVGQKIYLDKSYANSVQIAVMDWLRHPIEALELTLKYDGKTEAVKTDARGLVPRISTVSSESKVEIFIKSLSSQTEKKIAEIVSGLGQQWVNLRSGAIAFKTRLEQHGEVPGHKDDKPAHKPQRRDKGQAQGEAIRPDHPVKQSKRTTSSNTTVLAVDFPQDLLAYFDHYKDEQPTQEDWLAVADKVECEVAVLKAIKEIESKHSPFYEKKLQNGMRVPCLLFERQHFHRLTCANGPHFNTKKHAHHGEGVKGCQSPYDKDPDISWPTAFEKYGTYDQAYLRLAKAYRHDPAAALKSASWGAFQIMGFNHMAAGYQTVEEFVVAMCTSEKTQLTALGQFLRADQRLRKAVQGQDWQTIAAIYNGPRYQKNNYDEKLKSAYKKYSKEA